MNSSVMSTRADEAKERLLFIIADNISTDRASHEKIKSDLLAGKSFKDVGADSLDGIEISMRIEEELGVDTTQVDDSVNEIFENFSTLWAFLSSQDEYRFPPQ